MPLDAVGVEGGGGWGLTLGSFWRMLWEMDAATVVMVTGLVEKGKAKCKHYYPVGPDGSTMKLGLSRQRHNRFVAGRGEERERFCHKKSWSIYSRDVVARRLVA